MSEWRAAVMHNSMKTSTSTDLLMRIHHGQLQIRVRVPTCSKLAVALIDVPLSCACCCAGAETANCRDRTLVLQQPDGHWHCQRQIVVDDADVG
jgi:hypothetical protein